MTTTHGGYTNQAGPGGLRPSAELVHVPRARIVLAELAHACGKSLHQLTQELRAELVPPGGTGAQLVAEVEEGEVLPDLAMAPQPAQRPEAVLAEKVRTVSLITTTPNAVEEQLTTRRIEFVHATFHEWMANAAWATNAEERERARLGLFAALNARRAIIESRTVDGWKPTVDEFARTWLCIARPDASVQRLKQEAGTAHRQLQPLFKRKTHGARLLSLDHPIPSGGTLTDLLTDHTAPAQNLIRWEPDTDRAVAVFTRLTPREQDLARAWATAAPAITWAEFADLANIPAKAADNLRRKLRRLGHQHQQTSTAPSTRTRSTP